MATVVPRTGNVSLEEALGVLKSMYHDEVNVVKAEALQYATAGVATLIAQHQARTAVAAAAEPQAQPAPVAATTADEVKAKARAKAAGTGATPGPMFG